MPTTPRSSLAALLCVALSGCALLPAIGLNLAAQGATGVAALTLGPMADMQERAETDRCAVFARKGIAITESFESAIPTNDGEVGQFEPVYWRLEFAREGYPQVERARTPTEGTLTITNRAVLFVPLAGATSVRIPYELVEEVGVQRSAVTGTARYMVVRSCYGRFDIVSFVPPRRGSVDPDATATAAAQLTARVAAFRAAADN
jgi:hypothetical protein